LPRVSTTPAVLVAKFAAGVIDTGDKFTTDIVDIGGKFAAGVLDLQISPQIYEKFQNDPNFIQGLEGR
jgi:hypothetical protein